MQHSDEYYQAFVGLLLDKIKHLTEQPAGTPAAAKQLAADGSLQQQQQQQLAMPAAPAASAATSAPGALPAAAAAMQPMHALAAAEPGGLQQLITTLAAAAAPATFSMAPMHPHPAAALIPQLHAMHAAFAPCTSNNFYGMQLSSMEHVSA